MVQLFDQIGAGQWFRYVTGVVEITGALALIAPGLVWFGGFWRAATMLFGLPAHVFVQYTKSGASDRAWPSQRADRLSAPRRTRTN